MQQNKRIWVRTLTRVLYAGGIIFLVSGVLLSAISIPVIAAGSAMQAPGETPTVCPCLTQTPISGVTHTPGPGGSSLLFTSGCNCSCTNTQAVVCNVGSSDMQQSVNWDLFFSSDGNPVLGQKVDTGKVGPLKVGQCTTLNYTPIKPGFYAYVVKQEPNHEGPGTVWSNSCQVSGACFPTSTPGSPTLTFTAPPPAATETATLPPPPATKTPTVPPPPPVSTFTPPPPSVTETATRAPLPVNLSAVCGYVGETTMLWKVANHTNQNIEFTWRVSSGSSETGSGSVGPNSDTYFTTSNSAKTVELFVNKERVDTENSVAPCKQNLVLSFACTPQGLAWMLHNPNNFAIDVVWKLDGQVGGRGPLGANAQVQLVVSQPGAHTVEVQWTDTRPETHTVSLTSDANSCVNVPPITPTVPTATYTATVPTPTLPVSTLTFTPIPTITNTLPVATLTPTSTHTLPAPTFTFTPTNTLPASTFTATVTPTATNTQVVVTVTPSLTPTNTNTPLPGQTSPPITIPTFTNTPQTPTSTPVTPTATSSSTPLPAPGFTFTATITPSATITPTVTASATATQVNTVPPPVAVSTPIIIPVTGADMLAPARTTGLIGKLFVNIGLVMLGMALALTGITRRG